MGLNMALAQQAQTNTDANGNSYTTYTNDPSNSRWYKLENGLTVILAQNKTKPRIQTLIATKAGSSSDPSDHTGLAHYLEHMLFKGTDKFGSLDYAQESIYLKQIDDLYEAYNHTTDEAKRKEIYRAIDSVSGLASKYAIANEYDKMLQSIGANGTNAFTSFEETVYVNDIPANQVETWLTIEAERFRNPILRLFHTELEAVYEEKNIGMDNEGRQVYEKLFEASFPNHNYGRQTTIGTIEHLKNPSLVEIRKYFHTYYVPNNMAIIMAGDLDYESTFELIKKNFAYMQNKAVPTKNFDDETALATKKIIEVVGPESESLTMGYRVPDALSNEATLVQLVDLILANSKTGLIDVNMVKAQKCLEAYCSPMLLKERGLHYFSGEPNEGQTLEELEQLFYDQIAKIKSGDFDMELIKSIVLNEKVSNISRFDSYQGTAYSLLDGFIVGNWQEELAKLDKMLTYSKEDIINFAKKYYVDGHVVVYKRQGDKPESVKIEKPEINKVEVNRGKNSDFAAAVLATKPNPIQPQILDYKEEIIFSNVRKTPIWKVKNGDEQLFSLYYVLDLGSRHDQKLALAVQYLELLGTSKYTTDEISSEFYKLACNYGVSAGAEQSYVYLNGLASSYNEALALFEHLLADVQPDQAKLDQFVDQVLKSRADAKTSKYSIMSKLRSYAMYGEKNPANNLLSESQLKSIKAEELTSYIRNLTKYPHKIWYSGPLSTKALVKSLKKNHPKVKTPLQTPNPVQYVMQEPTNPVVYFAHYDMVQAEINWIKKSNLVNPNDAADISVFNEYFGGGMGSIVFQEIRESKALAYSCYGYYVSASKLGENNYMMSYVGTQADKLKESIEAMTDLLTTIPLDSQTFNNSKNALQQGLQTGRQLKMGIIFAYDRGLKLGIEEDNRAQLAQRLETISLNDLAEFHKNRVGGNYILVVLGSDEKLDMEYLKSLGTVKILSLEELFGY